MVLKPPGAAQTPKQPIFSQISSQSLYGANPPHGVSLGHVPKAYGLVLFVIGITIVVTHLPFPWHQIVDAGVVINLITGTLSLMIFSFMTSWLHVSWHFTFKFFWLGPESGHQMAFTSVTTGGGGGGQGVVT